VAKTLASARSAWRATAWLTGYMRSFSFVTFRRQTDKHDSLCRWAARYIERWK